METNAVNRHSQNSKISILLVYLLLSVSGSLFYKYHGDKYFLSALLISIIVWLAFTDRRLNEKFVLYLSVFAGFLLIIHFYTDGSLSLPSVIGQSLKLIFAYLVLNTVRHRFLETYINVVVFLAAFSLFGFMTDRLNLFNGIIRALPGIGEYGYEGLLYAFRYYYQGFGRNNSIFFEPGAYQGILNSAIFMIFFLNAPFSARRKVVYMVVLMIALFTTYSTTGYLIFSGMVMVLLFASRVISFPQKLSVIGAVLVAATIYFVEFKEVLWDKIYNYTQIEDLTDSHGHRRSFDMLVDIEIFKRNIMGVGFTKYFEYFTSIGMKGGAHPSSSNGVTKTFAVLGLPFGLFLFGSYFWALQRMIKNWLLSIVAFILLLMFFFGEAYYVFTPLCLAIIVGAFVYKASVSQKEEDEKISTNATAY